jgi:hypothetical protein
MGCWGVLGLSIVSQWIPNSLRLAWLGNPTKRFLAGKPFGLSIGGMITSNGDMKIHIYIINGDMKIYHGWDYPLLCFFPEIIKKPGCLITRLMRSTEFKQKSSLFIDLTRQK